MGVNLALFPPLKSVRLAPFRRVMNRLFGFAARVVHSERVRVHAALPPPAPTHEQPRLLEFGERAEHSASAQSRFFLERGDRRKTLLRLVRRMAGKRIKHKSRTVAARALLKSQHCQYAIPAHFACLFQNASEQPPLPRILFRHVHLLPPVAMAAPRIGPGGSLRPRIGPGGSLRPRIGAGGFSRRQL